MEGASRFATDHNEIRRWAEERGGQPASVKGTGRGRDDVGVLRIDFPGYGAEQDQLDHISWDEFFDKFAEKDLAIVYQDRTHAGEPSRFCKFVGRRSEPHGRAEERPRR